MAGALTLAMALGLTAYAIFTKKDFTVCGGMLFIMLCVFIVAAILASFFDNKWGNLIISVVGVLLFGAYLIYDT